MNKLLCLFCLILLPASAAWAADGAGIKAETLAKATASWDGKPLPPYPDKSPEISILRITIPPGTTLPLHKHPVINAGILLKGQLTVVKEDGATLHLKAGDTLVEVVNTWHYGKNEGSEPAEIVVFYAGAVGMPITVKKTD